MLSILAFPKPFRGHIATIQRNAIGSWTRLRPQCEIFLFGDDEGTAEVAKEFSVCHVPEMARNEYGTQGMVCSAMSTVTLSWEVNSCRPCRRSACGPSASLW
jgi:hypothetical protein